MRRIIVFCLSLVLFLVACSPSEQQGASKALPLNILLVKQGFPLNQQTVAHVYKTQDEDGTYSITVLLKPAAAKSLSQLTIRALDDVLIPVYGDQIISKGITIRQVIGKNIKLSGYSRQMADDIIAGVRHST